MLHFYSAYQSQSHVFVVEQPWSAAQVCRHISGSTFQMIGAKTSPRPIKCL